MEQEKIEREKMGGSMAGMPGAYAAGGGAGGMGGMMPQFASAANLGGTPMVFNQ